VKRVLIAGLGNVLRGDDGFGVRVLQEMSRIDLPRGVDLYEAGGAGIALVQKLMDGYDACIIVDAARKNGTPGTLYRLVPEAATDRELGTHDLDPGKILALARAMGALPAEVLLIGCEPQETEELCEELSSAVAAVVGQAVQAVLKELARLCD
jgi:hydrogenase maturation protease